MLENEEDVVAEGVFAPDAEDPEHSNAHATSLWELALMKYAIHPSVAEHASMMAQGRPLKLPAESPCRICANMCRDAQEGFISSTGVTWKRGRLLDSRGFREVDELSADMHSHESDYDGALDKYSERSTSRDVAKYPGARDRALRIVSYLGRMDREEDRRRSGSRRARAEKKKRNGDDASGDDGEGEGDFDPWASVKRYL